MDKHGWNSGLRWGQKQKKGLPQSNRLSIPVCAHHLPGLISDLYVPIFILLSVLPVMIPFLLNQFPGFWIPNVFLLVLLLVLSTFPCLSDMSQVRNWTGTPGPQAQTIQVFFSGAGGWAASLKLCQVGAGRASVPRGSYNMTKTIREPFTTALRAFCPGWEIRYNAVLLARNEATLF